MSRNAYVDKLYVKMKDTNGEEKYADISEYMKSSVSAENPTDLSSNKDFTGNQRVFLKTVVDGDTVGSGWFIPMQTNYTTGGVAYDHPETGYQWVRQEFIDTQKVNVKWFGAKGDGANDDKNAINNALDHTDEYRTVELPNGTFYTSGSVYIKSNTTFKSNGSSVLKHRYIYLDRDIENVVIDGITFDGDVDSTTWMYGIRFYYGGQKNITIRNCKFINNAVITQDWTTGVETLAENILIENCEFTFNADSVQNNVDVIKLYGDGITIRNCKFNVTNTDELFKFADHSKNISIENNIINGSFGEEIIDIYQCEGPVKFVGNIINISGGGILRMKPGDVNNQYPFPYDVLFSNNTIEYSGSTDNLIYMAGAYTLSWALPTEQKVIISNNTIKTTTMPTTIRVTGVHKAIISNNNITSENSSVKSSFYIHAVKNLTLTGNTTSTGYVTFYPTSTPASESYASTYTGNWTISGNNFTSTDSVSAVLYVYGQHITSLNINGNTINVAANNIGNGIRIRNCTIDHLSTTNNVISNYDGGYAQYAKVDLLDTTATNLNIDNKGSNIINVKDFGAVGDGVTDDTTAIQNAINYATQSNETIYSGVIGSKTKVYGEGTFKITSTINLTCEADFRNATFIVPSTFASTALKVQASDGSSYLRLSNTYLPNVKVENKVDNWTNASTGVEITSLIDSKITLGEVWYFQTGVKMTTWASKGLSYNEFYLNSIRNNKVGLHIYPATSGWTNDNNFYGGRIRIDSGFSDYTGTVLLHLTGNNNVFYKLVVEGNYDETKIWLDANSYGYGCAYNKFINLRPESSSVWQLIVDGSGCLRNTIVDGYIADFGSEVNYVAQNSATAEALTIKTSREDIRIGSDQYGIMKLQNKTSDSYPIISLYSTTYDPKADPDKATSKITSTGFEFKANYSYTNPYLKADPSIKGLIIGRANLDLANAPYLKTDYLDGTWQLTIQRGALRLPNSAYNQEQLILGNYYIWVDSSGNLRIKNGAPTSDTDGTIVGTQS